ncbi:hypothetical protein NXX09_23605 [Bacteroides uniformis]|nr:hypothetical protein [Bacteroides uniformis]
MGAKGIAVDDFAQAIKDVLEGNQDGNQPHRSP